jgi:exodeoxyribonuclease VII large subunit
MSTNAVSVSELTVAIKALLEEGIGEVIVTGEISNYKQHSSGHRYFTLKDGDAQIAAVMWRSRPLAFRPEDGMEVRVRATLTVYPPQGRYQLDVAAMRPEGMGDLHKAFEQLKEALRVRGYFDPVHKRPLPSRPRRIGIATSPTGAALQDMLSTISNRLPVVDVVFRPALVQGEGAAPDIAKAIAELDDAGCDVIIVGRGGGSLEDLWAFNTEIVATAIYNASTPIISAVGHETDVTISDFVADRRAETPTAAAVLVTPITKHDLLAAINEARERMTSAVGSTIDELHEMATSFLDGRAARRIVERVHVRTQRIDDLATRTTRTLRQHLTSLRHHVDHASAMAVSHHPLTPLRKGYAVIERNGQVLNGSTPIASGDVITLRRQTETSTATITTITPNS